MSKQDYSKLPELNINYLKDGDLVIYSDGTVEEKINSTAVYASAKLVPINKTISTKKLKPMKYKVTTSNKVYGCYIEKIKGDKT